jgi:hypothetical protein
MTKAFEETARTGIAFRAGVRGLPYRDQAPPIADTPVETDLPQGPIERGYELLDRLPGLSEPIAAYETGRAMRMVGHILDAQESPPEHGARFVTELAGATLTFSMRGERQPWGAEDTAFIFLDVFVGSAPAEFRDELRTAIVGYARKRPIVARKG